MQLKTDADGSPTIAITGVGLVTSLGVTAEATWQAVIASQSRAQSMPAIESTLPTGADGHQAAELPAEFAPELPRETRYLRWTIESALRDAGVNKMISPARRAVTIGTTLHGMRAGGRFYRTEDATELQSFLAGDVLRRALDGLNLTGPATTSCSACSSGLGSIAIAATLLKTGAADLVVAGGYDTVSEYVWAGFNALRLVADGPPRPFTRDRRGMKLGEGYAILILERAGDAERRSARVRAIVSGWGESADAHHLTQSHPHGAGAVRSMQQAMTRANAVSSSIDLVSAHATGTPDNDAAEYAALRQVFADRLSQTPVVCFKTHLGHTLGAAGAAELILSTMAIQHGMVPPTAHVDPAQIEFDQLQLTRGARPTQVRRTLNLSLGFGGANACVVLSAPSSSAEPTIAVTSRDEAPKPAAAKCEVWITGVGVVLPGAVGLGAFVERLTCRTAPVWESPPPGLADVDFEHLLNARRMRRMSLYTKLALASAHQACSDAGLASDTMLLAATGAMLGTTHGAVGFCHEYYQQIVRDGVLAANPVLFAEGVPNVGAAQLSLMLGLNEACQSIIGTRTAGLDALRMAWLRIASGQADRVVVGAAEESSPLVDRIYEQCGLRGGEGLGPPYESSAGFRTSSGSVSFVLESADSARARRVEAYARISHAAAARSAPDVLPKTVANLLRDVPGDSHWMGSGSGTWIDRAEADAIVQRGEVRSLGRVYDRFGESFSVTPLTSAAAVLMLGHLPNAIDPSISNSTPIGASPRPTGPIDRFGVICSDWQGGVATAHLEIRGRSRVASGT